MSRSATGKDSAPAPERILIVQPSWVGDAVMATPTLRAIRELYPQAHITYLMRRYVKSLYGGMPWADRLLTYRTAKPKGKAKRGIVDLSIRLRQAEFDLAILLPNSFKTALLCKLAKVKRTLGYDRDGRGFLLDDKLLPQKERGRFVPSPIVKYYMGLAQYLGSQQRDMTMQLFVTDADRREAIATLQSAGLSESLDRPAASGGPPLVILNVGAQYGAAKLWPAARFAAVGDELSKRYGATVLVSGTPKERQIINSVRAAMGQPSVDLSQHGLTLGALKEVVRRCDLMVTNDTGPRHIAAAMGVPVITIFGPTHPQWTEIYFERERKVQIPVFCGPCQKKICPLDHRCMTGISPAMVLGQAAELLAMKPPAPAGAPTPTLSL